MAKSPPDTVMAIENLSKYLKIFRSTLYKLVQEGKLPSQKVGRHWMFHKDAIDRWRIGYRQQAQENWNQIDDSTRGIPDWSEGCPPRALP